MTIDRLKSWFLKEKRTFPWREDPSPYRVWISEIMLQQTRAAVVIDFFTRWMKQFPTIEALSKAPLEEVMKAWEGLGYYSRARNLKAAAQDLMEKYGGSIPSSLSDLLKIKGVGSYTAGAIASFAFHIKAVALDGNVARVMSRYFLIEEEIDKPVVKKKLEALVSDFLPEEEPWVIMEALIELGALVCQRKALCAQCPLNQSCLAYQEGKTDVLPIKKKRRETVFLSHHVAIIFSEGDILVQKRQEGKVLGGLFEFPSFPVENTISPFSIIEKVLSLQVEWKEDLPMQFQSFTHHKLELYPSLYGTKDKIEIAGHIWKPYHELSSLPFSSGHKRILGQLQKEHHAHFTH